MSDTGTCCGNPSPLSDAEFAKFCELKSKEGAIPSGKIDYVTGEIVFIDGNGVARDSESYAKKHGFDPAPVWERILEWRKSNGLVMLNPVVIGRIKLPKRQPVKLGMIANV